METADINELAAFISDKSYCRIGIDGVSGAGKSTMSSKLSKIIRLSYLNLDDFLDKEKGGFLDYLKYDEIRQHTL